MPRLMDQGFSKYEDYCLTWGLDPQDPTVHRVVSLAVAHIEEHTHFTHSVQFVLHDVGTNRYRQIIAVSNARSNTGCCRRRQRRSSSLCNSQCHGYLLSKRTIGRMSAQVESDSPSCILHYGIVRSSTKAMLCNLRLQT